ncbi:hypothetical protein SCACP_13370 [Sporomusa carbonis]|uniref:hypothetical protein n=1 Tax=Sporomusa carbonis TaxID=3076075 RepID=UPI003A76B0BA
MDRKTVHPGHVVLLSNGVKGLVGILPTARLVVWHTDNKNTKPHPYPFMIGEVVKNYGRIASHR